MKKILIFGLSGSKKLCENICKQLKIKPGKIDITNFADGEVLISSKETVRNCDVFVVQSTAKPVNDNLMELFIAIDMLKRASAKEINLIIPYYGYARQDRKATGREPISAKLVANLLTNAGASRVVLLDIHSDQIQGFFDIPVDTLRASSLLLQAYLKNTDSFADITIVSPDYGAVKRARKIAEDIGAPLAIIDKRRPCANVAEAINVLGDVFNKKCLIVDDMIDTGGTVIAAAELLKNKGAKEIVLLATHGLFSKNAVENFNKAADKKIITEIYTTNSIEEVYKKDIKNLKIIDISIMLTDVIDSIIKGNSISKIYEKYTKRRVENKFKEK